MLANNCAPSLRVRVGCVMHASLMGGSAVHVQAAAYMGPEHEAAFQVLCRWSAALGYILMAHLDGHTSLDDAAKVQAAHTYMHSPAHPSCMPLVQ